MGDSGFIAHVRFDEEGQAIEHLLEHHLKKVGRRAGSYASGFDSSEWAQLAGIWHDLGKYNLEFQAYIRDQTGYERENAHVEIETKTEAPKRVDHSTAGAIYAVEKLGIMGRIPAYLIAGHHAGLPDWHKDEGPGRPLKERIAEQSHLTKALSGNAVPADILTRISHPVER